MKLFKTLIGAAVLAFAAGPLLAVEHNVRIERGGFYPPKVYVQYGDTINFINAIPQNAHLHSANFYDTRLDWEIQTIPPNQTRKHVVLVGQELHVRAPCFRTEVPGWWYDDSHTEYQITQIIRNWASYYENRRAAIAQAEDDICDGWQYNRYHNMLTIVIGSAPLGY